MAGVRPPIRIGLPLPKARRAARAAASTAEADELRVQSVSHRRLTWVNIERPTEREIEFLRANYSFHPLDLDDCLSPMQTPKIDEYEDYLFVVLHFPVFNATARVTTPAEVDMFIGENYVITVHSGALRPLRRLFRECADDERIRQAIMGRSAGYLLYQILDRLIDYCFPILNKITANVNRVEEEIFDDSVLDNVREITVLRRDIIAFRRIIKPQMAVIASLEQRDVSFLKEELDVYFGDLADHMNKIWDSLEDLKDVVESLNDTNNTLASHRTNDALRVLTVISTIALPMWVITGLYGMNVALPVQDEPWAFLLVFGVSTLMGGGMLTVFRWQRWI